MSNKKGRYSIEPVSSLLLEIVITFENVGRQVDI